MKSLKITTFAIMLALALVSVSFTSVEAKKADTSDVLTPKSFGLKTISKVNTAKSFDDKSAKPTLLKSEQVKTQLKMLEAKKAQELFTKRYGM